VTDAAYLDARYGRRSGSPGRRRLAAGAGLAVGVALVFVIFVWSRSSHVPSATVTGFHADSPTQTTVHFTVTKEDGQRVSCRVEAQDQYTDVVGSVDVTLPAAGDQVSMRVVIPTRQKAVIGQVDSCRALN
jgi:Domain of unknown function (DUF4307)